MFTRSLTRSLRHVVPSRSTDACAVCACSCGHLFVRQKGPVTIQKRRRQGWVTKDGRWRITLGKLGAQSKRQQLKYHTQPRVIAWYQDALKQRRNAGEIEADVDSVTHFLSGLHDLAEREPVSDIRRGMVHVDISEFKKLVEQANVGSADLARIATMLLAPSEPEYIRTLGKRMMFTLSNSGHAWATEMLLRNALREHKVDKYSLKRLEYVEPLKELQRFAARDGEWRLLILGGRIAYELGDHDAAIRQWMNVTDEAMAAATDPANIETNNDLSAFWTELSQALMQKKDYEKAKWAIEIGCGQDDPSSHYVAASLEKQTNQDSTTSKWLYHMMKAAASGQVKAVHELGIFYGYSDWRYVVDEPPDHIKPTPFDSYPPDRTVTKSAESLWNRARSALGLVSPVNSQTENAFHSAVFPHTPYGRFQMALKWLEVSMGFLYSPSYLVAANLLLQKTLRPLAAAPKEALELSGERYQYSSRADFEAKIPIKHADVLPEEPEIPNPGYDPSLAKLYLREVFFAQQSMQYLQTARSKRQQMRRRGDNTSAFNPEPMLGEERLAEVLNWNMRKWLRFPEVRRLYMDETKMRLYDDVQEVNLMDEAVKICNAQGWDMADDEGGLLYKHGSMVPRG